MKNIILRLVVSPALMGSIFMFVGYLSTKHPPKDTSRFYGYRTRKSMQNNDTWKEANTFSRVLMYKIGVAAFFLGIILSITIRDTLIIAFATIAFSAIFVGALIILTERRLDRIFDKNGVRKI